MSDFKVPADVSSHGMVPPIERRAFLKMASAAGAGMFVTWPAEGGVHAFFGMTPALTPYVDPLPIPATLTPTGIFNGLPLYEVRVQQMQHQVHSELPATTMWGYNGVFPGPTFDVNSGDGIYVKWINDLRDGSGAYLTTHHLPVDLCLHGPMELGPTPRTVTHLHGGHVPWTSDGFPEHTQLPGEEVTYLYPNNQESAGIWYHDHAMGITRLNNYLGLLGHYLIRDSLEASLNVPSGDYEIPLVLCDRSFNDDGSLNYPAQWQQHFFGDVTLVNGTVWPHLDVEPRKYRFRILNASNARTYTLSFDNGLLINQIGSDGGLLEANVPLTSLTLSTGERADVIVDFSGQSGNIHLQNSASAPFHAETAMGMIPQVMQFRVSGTATDTSSLPGAIRTIPALDPNTAVRTRTFVLDRVDDSCVAQGVKWVMNGLGWTDITEYVELDTTEIWVFQNVTNRVHPMHLHLESFQILDRAPVGTFAGGTPPAPNEAGWKDTVLVNAFEQVRVIVHFSDYIGNFVYHCHVLEHEDHEMMRQFIVVKDLPVELTDFQVRVTAQHVVLQWETRTETNNAGFGIERAELQQNGIFGTWTELAFIEGAGSTLTRQTYTHELSLPSAGAYQFRLRQVDFDGTTTYSDVVEALIELPGPFLFDRPYPNPFATESRFHMAVRHEQSVRIQVLDIEGRVVATLHDGSLAAQVKHAFTVRADGLANGHYLVRATGDHFDQVRSVILQR